MITAEICNTSNKNLIINLWSAVLKSAVEDLHSDNKVEQYWAREWIKSEDVEFPSFIAICTILNLDPEKVSKIIRRKENKNECMG